MVTREETPTTSADDVPAGRVVLINPNGSAATTRAMTEDAAAHLAALTAGGARVAVLGRTVTENPPMLLDEAALAAAAGGVVREGVRAAEGRPAALVVAAFGDPGVAALRARTAVGVVGIGEAGLRAGAADGRSFAVVTTTPRLAGAIAEQVTSHGLGARFTGVVLTEGDPVSLAGDPAAQTAALADAVERAVRRGAQAVVVGGGPLARSAPALAASAGVPVVDPVRAACRVVAVRLGASTRG